MKSKIISLLMIFSALTMVVLPPARAQGGAPQKRRGGNPGYLPNLVVYKVTMGDPATGEFTVVVQNRVMTKAQAGQCRLSLRVKDGSGKTVAFQEVVQPPIAPTKTVILKISAGKALGAYQDYEITTDSTGIVAETKESDNVWRGNTGKV